MYYAPAEGGPRRRHAEDRPGGKGRVASVVGGRDYRCGLCSPWTDVQAPWVLTGAGWPLLYGPVVGMALPGRHMGREAGLS